MVGCFAQKKIDEKANFIDEKFFLIVYALIIWGAKLVQKLVLKKYVFVNLFIKFLKEERRVIFLLFFVRHILGCASSPTFVRHILGCASSPTFLRLSFAHRSL